MISDCRPWLPADAALPVAVQRELAEMVENWSREWFAGEPMRVAGPIARVTSARSELRKLVWHASDQDVAIGLPPVGLAVLGAMVLGVATATGSRNAQDITLLDALGKECLDSLKTRAARLFGLIKPVWHVSEAGRGEAGVHRVEIVTAQRGLALQIELSDAGFARFLRGALPESPAAAPLAGGSRALAALPVAPSAVLGRCGLTVAELAGLGVGDVLVLDRTTADALPLAIGGVPLVQGACTVVETERGPALKIVQALVG